MTKLLLARVNDEISVKLSSPDRDIFTALVESLKDTIAPSHRRYDSVKRRFMVKGDLLNELMVWIDGARENFFVEVEWATAQKAHEAPPPRPRSTPPRADAYAALFLLPTAPKAVVKAAYRALAQLNHPDLGGDTSAMQRINAAYKQLAA